MNSLCAFGVCPEVVWPYDVKKVKIRPSWKAYRAAYAHRIKSFYKIFEDPARPTEPIVWCISEFVRQGSEDDFLDEVIDQGIQVSADVLDGKRVVVSGDYKRRPDPTCAPFEVVRCDALITEATSRCRCTAGGRPRR